MFNEKEFLEEYIRLFLLLINFAGTEEVNALEENYYKELDVYDEMPMSDEEMKQIEINLADEYEKKLFKLIKDEVASSDPEFFNNAIEELNETLSYYSDCAKNLRMVIPSDQKKLKIKDYYDNYKKALERYSVYFSANDNGNV